MNPSVRVSEPPAGAAWQLACGAIDGARVDAELLWAGAPFGVGYTIARWDLQW